MQGKKLKSAITKYLEQGKELNLRSASIRNRRDRLNRLLRFLKGRPLNLETTRFYIKHLGKKGYQPSSIRNEIKQIRAFTNFLLKRKYISKDFGRDLLSPKVPRKQLELIAPELIEEIIFTGCASAKSDNKFAKRVKKNMKVALRFQLRTGLRVGELCRLKGSDFRLGDNPPNFTLISKGGNEDILPIPRDMIKDLKLRVRKARVFEVTPEGLNRALQRGARKLGIKTRVHCHLLRHIFCTALLREGVPIAKVKRLMRHSTLKYTDDTYSHYTLDDLDTALNAFPIIRSGLHPDEIFDLIEKETKRRIKGDGRFRLTVDRTEEELTVKLKQKSWNRA